MALPDYEATAGAVRDGLAADDGGQPGDPDKAARAVLPTPALPNSLRRLPLGDDAGTAMRAHPARVASDAESTTDIGTCPAITLP
ncbi:Rossmann-fold NAD(P)-binding domain-containing protein [Streptomyces marincola]|uniref:hypothetical protein n=1 Tax=Streptomyces marincola TaxID=2878388 RepID=UPI001CF38D8B|nr:hypothetical protein [Streptomyces marincola]UCM91613.1 hypothetical protein LC193_28700 [Streptomyces marincola]